MFKAIKAWRKLIRLLREDRAWKLSDGALLHGSHVMIMTGSTHGAHVAIDNVVIPLGPWRRWRLKRHVMRLMLQKLDKNL